MRTNLITFAAVAAILGTVGYEVFTAAMGLWGGVLAGVAR